jgi:hypothetical protein
MKFTEENEIFIVIFILGCIIMYFTHKKGGDYITQ